MVYYYLSFAKNSVLVERLGPALADARAFTEVEYQTIKSWSRSCRVNGIEYKRMERAKGFEPSTFTLAR